MPKPVIRLPAFPSILMNSATRRASTWWAFSPAQDLAFILLTPLALLLLFQAAGRGGWMDGLLAFGLASAMGHYLPGMLRAYGDRSLFRRFRIRLIVAPVFLYGMTVALAWLNYGFIFLLVGVWGAWHWTMQVYGFSRIYDAKTPTSSTPAIMDRALCVLWFGMCIFVLNDVPQVYVVRLYENGGPPLSATAIEIFSKSWLAATVILTATYLIWLAWSMRSGLRPNPLKFVFIAVTFSYLSYTAGQIDRPVVGYAMFEMWHDIQYLAIVWMFNLARARKNPESGSFIRFLFRPKVSLALLYIGACLAFGMLTHAWQLFSAPVAARIAASIVLSTAMLHYYLDGFIWRIRESDTRAALGVGDSPGVPEKGLTLSLPPQLRHALPWLLFVVPGCILFAAESRQTSRRPPLMVYEELVKTFPDSAHAHYELGRELQDMGRFQESRPHLERSLALAPRSQPALAHLGVLLADQGNSAAARPYLERAVEISPRDVEVRNNLAIVLEDLGELEQARAQLATAVDLDRNYALAHTNLGIVSSKLGDTEGALRHLQDSLKIDSEDPSAHNALGEVLLKTGRREEAKASFEQALKLDPGFTPAKKNLAALMTK